MHYTSNVSTQAIHYAFLIRYLTISTLLSLT
jgi:hypothetical protein